MIWSSGVFVALCTFAFAIIAVYPVIERLELVYDVKQKIFLDEAKSIRTPPLEEISFNITEAPTREVTPSRTIFYVKNSKELHDVVDLANRDKIPVEVVLYPGEYILEKTLDIESDWFYVRSLEDNPKTTVVKGKGMYGGVGNLFRVKGSYFHVRALTLAEATFHLIQIAGESAANFPIIEDSVLVDAKEQFIKISYSLNTPNMYSTGGIVRNCYFYFSRGIAPHYYTGGVDGHGVRHWVIENNLFADIASPAQHIAEHAIHLWNNSAFNIVRGNIIMDSDRGVGFGMGKPEHPNVIYGNLAGEIYNNYLYQSNNNHPFSDVAIVLESSVGTKITGNYAYSEREYPRAIEYRFRDTADVLVQENRVNRRIASRDNGKAIVKNNSEILKKEAFMEQLLIHAKKTGMNNRYPEFFVKLKDYSDNTEPVNQAGN